MYILLSSSVLPNIILLSSAVVIRKIWGLIPSPVTSSKPTPSELLMLAIPDIALGFTVMLISSPVSSNVTLGPGFKFLMIVMG